MGRDRLRGFFAGTRWGGALAFAAVLFLIGNTPALALSGFEEELEMINRPVNLSGLTGLLFTAAPYTLPVKNVEVAVGTNTESSVIPDINVNELPIISVTAGIAQNMELAAKSSYFHKRIGTAGTQRGSGDAELSYKWNFLPQSESSANPAVALIVTGIVPTSNKNLNLGTAAHWGARCGMSIGREITWSDHVLGAYMDGQVAVHDLSDDRNKDIYGILNIGLLYPISKYRNLQLLLEYNRVAGVNRISDIGGDYAGLTYGLRMVSERFNLTIGAQFLRNEALGFDNASRVIGMASIKF